MLFPSGEASFCFIASFIHQVEINQNQLLNPRPVLMQLLHKSLLNPAVAALRLLPHRVKVYNNWYGDMSGDEGQKYIDKKIECEHSNSSSVHFIRFAHLSCFCNLDISGFSRCL